jgi:membrane protease YdiL (CAAX protease family)
VRRIEKKPFFDQISLKSKRVIPDFITGLSLGLVFVLSAFFASYIRYGNLSIAAKLSSPEFLLAIIITFATAITEEIFARGFILKRLYEEWGNSYSAAFFSSLLFLIIHIPILITNLKLSGNLLLLFFATDFILSLVNSFVFLERKSLVAPILIHALYNIAILFYL